MSTGRKGAEDSRGALRHSGQSTDAAADETRKPEAKISEKTTEEITMTKVGKRKMTRKDYEAVRKMDRNQFDRFCNAMYEQGAADQRAKLLAEVRTTLMETKGIGAKRTEQVMKNLEGLNE